MEADVQLSYSEDEIVTGNFVVRHQRFSYDLLDTPEINPFLVYLATSITSNKTRLLVKSNPDNLLQVLTAGFFPILESTGQLHSDLPRSLLFFNLPERKFSAEVMMNEAEVMKIVTESSIIVSSTFQSSPR